MSDHDECHDPVPPGRRDEALERDGHQCQVCGRCGPGAGGVAELHVHHITRDPEGDEHALGNLTTLCRQCHSWQHQRSTGEEVPVEITEDDRQVLLPKDYSILQVLAENGPASTGDIADALSADVSVMAVRERLWVLMGLDNVVSARDQQIVDQDADNNEWGLTGQIAESARGRIPDDPQTMLQRMEDEQVRQALERGCDRETIATVLDVSRRTTFYKEKRAHAYDFPLAAIDGGRPADTPNDGESVSDTQTQLDIVDEMSGDHGVSENVSAKSTQTNSNNENRNAESARSLEGEEDVVEASVQQALDALKTLRAAL